MLMTTCELKTFRKIFSGSYTASEIDNAVKLLKLFAKVQYHYREGIADKAIIELSLKVKAE